MSSNVVHSGSVASAADFGDVRAEFAALVSSAGLFDLSSRAKIVLTGGDRVRWLNGMITNNVRDLAVGHGIYAFLLNPQGHILGDLYAFNRGESIVISTERSQLEKILATFDHYIIMDDVEVKNVSDEWMGVGIAGPAARQLLDKAGIDVPDLKTLQFAEMTWQGAPLTLVRTDHPAVDEYELWISSERASSLWDHLVKAGTKPTGTSALDLFRIASGIPRYGQDIRERDLPQETEQARALHFSKGCYIGQEIVERIRSRGAVHRMFTAFGVEGPLPAVGSKIQSDGRDVGEVTSAASLPLPKGDFLVALGYIRREVATPGRKLQAGDANLVVTTPPFTQAFPQRQ